jgi:6-pyruvoyltetrahydropterin/6-carboxytetrahydropterin synthase
MKAHLHRRYHFSASHRLHSDSLSEEQNRAVYGKCNNPFGHGHNYSVEVTVSGPVDTTTGMVMNLAELDELVDKEVVARFDHVNLNLQTDFLNTVPTTENLTTRIFERLQKHFPRVTLERIRVEETSNNTFDYAGKKEISH